MRIKRNITASANSNALNTLGITPDEFKIVLTWCYWYDPNSDVGFEDENSGQFITNPFVDPTGRFDLTVSESIETYGVDNVKYFCNGVLDIINNYAEKFF